MFSCSFSLSCDAQNQTTTTPSDFHCPRFVANVSLYLKDKKKKNPERLYLKIYIIRRKYVLYVAFTTWILFGNFNRFALIVCRKWTITLSLILLQFCLPIASMVCLTVQRLMLLKVYFLILFIEMVPDYTYLILLRVAMYNGFYVPMIYINCPTINSLILLIISRLQNRSQDDCNDFLWFW